jgi:predicted outer membrane protein
MRPSAKSIATLAAVLLVGGCTGGGGGSRTRVPSAAVTPAVIAAPVMLSAAAYVAAASSIDLFEVKSAELALQRAQDPQNRAFAQRALSAHRGTSAQLSFAGRRLNLLPSATLNPEHQALYDALLATSDFDNTYRAQQGIVMQQGVKLHSDFARSGNSPTLRPIAENAENVMRANLQALRGTR